MTTEIDEIVIKGIMYVPKGQENALASKVEGLELVLIRTYSAGVFAGYLKSRKGQEVILEKARRLWYWKGAASLSQLAIDGVSSPQECKFPAEFHDSEPFCTNGVFSKDLRMIYLFHLSCSLLLCALEIGRCLMIGEKS